MNFSNFILDLLAFGAIISSVLVITSKNPVISVLFLIALFISSACYLLVLGVGFVGLSYLIIYVGAITVLFLFVIMMINIRLVDLLEVGSEYTQNLPLGFIVTGLFFYEVLTVSPISLNYDSIFYIPLGVLNFLNALFISTGSDNFFGEFFQLETNLSDNISTIYNLSSADSNLISFLQIEMLGQGLYTYGSVLLILIGFILLLAMLGPIVLSLRSTRTENNPSINLLFFKPYILYTTSFGFLFLAFFFFFFFF